MKSGEVAWILPRSRSVNEYTFVACLKNAYVYRDESVIFGQDWKFLKYLTNSMSDELDHHAVLLQDRFLEPNPIDYSIASINGGIYDNYFHWMMETLPKFGLVELSGIPVEIYLVSSSFDFQRDCLNLLGIDLSKTLCPKSNNLMAVRNLVAPSAVGPVGVPSTFAVEYLRKKFSGYLSTATPSRRLFITRADASTRRIVNEATLFAALARLGFEAVRMSDLPLVEQTRMFSEAELVVGPHGAGMTNVVFMGPQSRGMIEFMPESYNHECFRQICEIRGTPYQRIISRSTDPATHDIKVDVEAAITAVKQTLGLAN